jgi:hypothetical protein
VLKKSWELSAEEWTVQGKGQDEKGVLH